MQGKREAKLLLELLKEELKNQSGWGVLIYCLWTDCLLPTDTTQT
jgi:hypothetical protein